MKRREFLKMLSALPAIGILFGIEEAQEEIGTIAPIASYDPELMDVLVTWYGPETVLAWTDTTFIISGDGGLTWEEFPGLEKYITTGKVQND